MQVKKPFLNELNTSGSQPAVCVPLVVHGFTPVVSR